MKGIRTKAYVEKLVKEKGIPYIDFCISKGYTPLLRYYSDIGNKANGKEQIYLYSCTKPLTVVCAMRLVEEGVIGLDDPVEKYLPEYANTFLLDEAGNRVPTKNKMTVRHLFTMSGGLSYDLNTQPLQEVKRRGGDTIDFVNGFVKTPLLFEPGERFEYSLCHDALAAVVQVASGKRFSEFMRETLFEPLGMTESGFHNKKEEELTDMYVAETDGTIRQVDAVNALVVGPEYDSGGAGVISRVDDYVKFGQTLACDGVAENGYRLLKKETLEQIRTEQHSGLVMNNTFTCVQGTDYGYGLGVRTRMRATEWGLPVGEFGWDGAAGAYLLVDPKNGISVVMGMHLRGWPYVFKGEHLEIVKRAYEDMKEEGLL